MNQFACATAILALACTGAFGQSIDELSNDGKNTDNVLTWMGYHQNRYSPLKQISKPT